MTPLRKMMLEELERRNYAQTTVDCYIQTVEDFARHFHRPPDQLTAEHIREYQAYLFRERKLADRLRVKESQSREPLRHGGRGECIDCGYRPAISYNSCRNRHCPKCQANARALPSVSLNTYRPRALSLPIHQAPGFELSLANYNRTKSVCTPGSITDSRVFLITATPLNLHKRFLTGGFLQTAVSNAPRTTSRTYLPSWNGTRPIQHLRFWITSD